MYIFYALSQRKMQQTYPGVELILPIPFPLKIIMMLSTLSLSFEYICQSISPITNTESSVPLRNPSRYEKINIYETSENPFSSSKRKSKYLKKKNCSL